jgi:leucine-rich repeat protein SHOC2
MQVDNINKRITSSLLSSEQNNINLISTSLLPLHGYEDNRSIKAQVLPLQVIITDKKYLPAELINIIQNYCSYQDLKSLASVNKAAFTARFFNPHLQHLHFNTAAQIQMFLLNCREGQNTSKLSHTLCVPERFQNTKKLSLTLSGQLGTKQCELLFTYLSRVESLHIYLPSSEPHMSEKQEMSLSQLLIAAQPLALKHLSVIQSDPAGWSNFYASLFDICDDDLPDEIWSWRNLETLTLKGLSTEEAVSDKISQLTALKSLELSNLLEIELPDILWKLDNLEHLILEGFTNSSVPESIGQFTALKSLELKNMYCLKTLPESLGQLTRLETLTIKAEKEGCCIIKELPEEIGQLSSLTSLELSNLSEFKKLPKNIAALKKLNTLVLYKLDKFKKIPKTIKELEKLEHLTLSRLKRLKGIPEEISQLTALTFLELSNLPHLNALPKSIGTLKKLETLTLYKLKKLEEIPEEIGQLKSLKNNSQ